MIADLQHSQETGRLSAAAIRAQPSTARTYAFSGTRTYHDVKRAEAVVTVQQHVVRRANASYRRSQTALGSGERQMPEDWFTMIVGKGNVNEGLLRIIGFIVIFIGGFGTLFWWLR